MLGFCQILCFVRKPKSWSDLIREHFEHIGSLRFCVSSQHYSINPIFEELPVYGCPVDLSSSFRVNRGFLGSSLIIRNLVLIMDLVKLRTDGVWDILFGQLLF